MYEKNIALCILLVAASTIYADHHYAYPAQQGYQADNGYVASEGYQIEKKHHHYHEDKISDEADQHRLTILDKEEADAAYYNNLARGGMVTGAVLALVGTLAMDKNMKIAGAGVTLFAISAVSAYGIGNRDDGRAILRQKERKDILDRRSKRHSHQQ